MSYRHLLVCLDEGERSPERLQFALRLATIHEARLTALYIGYMPFAQDTSPDNSRSLLTTFRDDQAHREERAHEAFDAACMQAGTPAEWRSVRSVDVHDAFGFARNADLVIAAQGRANDGGFYVGELFTDRLILSAGRPVLVIPDSGPLPQAFRQIAIAWNGSREAIRAVADALPLLQCAEAVMAFEVTPPPERHSREPVLPPADVRTFLASHGVNVELMRCSAPLDAGDWLLARASNIDMEADLLIAGAYGHSRVSELILGGVTRTLLQDMTMPVLMSH